MIPEIQTWPEFKTSVENELNRRLKLFKHYTSIVPSANKIRKELSWYINKRNTPHKQIFQHTDVIDMGEISVESTAVKLHHMDSNEDETVAVGNKSGNPDLLAEGAGFW